MFDHWMRMHHADVPFARYADDAVVHCRTHGEAEALLRELQQRFASCGLQLHPVKTKIVYCGPLDS